jgi:hypothetical protein
MFASNQSTKYSTVETPHYDSQPIDAMTALTISISLLVVSLVFVAHVANHNQITDSIDLSLDDQAEYNTII